MTRPYRSLLWMIGFLAAIAALVALIAPRLVDAFQANPFFNGIILLTLACGIAVNLRQVLMLNRDIDWMEHFRRANPERPVPGKPRLLVPMARMLAGRERGKLALTPTSMRTVLDGVYLRLEESRDLSRYLIGLAIFLGLLGTFWGLLATIRSVSDIIGSLDVGSDAAAMFTALKANLREPLAGMSTSFSTSLFGLASSLIVGFLDLQAGHAQNRFYNELEEWLSSLTRLSGGTAVGVEGDTSVPAYVQALLEQTADGLERMHRALVENDRERRASNEHLGELSGQLAKLTEFLARDARERHASLEVQEELRTVLKSLAAQSQGGQSLSDDLRSEFRLLSRTIAAAMDTQRRPAPADRGY
ncbi:flagellar motor protein MotA [Tahibacter amnicola]|uniref:Flagellar motor protein MotA n=1 Tax=Tahibacter amnicola TaxID=2976241 RepID=A0ABY6BHE9_9GAMM|nr:flagellar motor protein MotA [Tahibacter amnicola]UXI68758.1 flagellar motor protein MotA [Tahibacter amnicola]